MEWFNGGLVDYNLICAFAVVQSPEVALRSAHAKVAPQ